MNNNKNDVIIEDEAFNFNDSPEKSSIQQKKIRRMAQRNFN
jgi:hypothetical protein